MGTVLVECISDSKNWNILEENTKIEGAEGKGRREGREGRQHVIYIQWRIVLQIFRGSGKLTDLH